MFPEDSGKVIAQAHTLGLKALVDLLRERTIRETTYLHSKAKKRLDIALRKWEMSFNQGNPDFSLVADQEKGLRDLELENIWETTASYGNTETKRVRNERDGSVGPLNRLINVFGANLRDYFILMYPLDTPVKIRQQKRKTIWGYASDEFGSVPVAHGADLAELDLADMVRSHGRELCRKWFIFGAPPNDFDSYALLLIRRLTPFVDYVYTDARLGSSHFLRPRISVQEKCADEILREIVDELSSLYATGSSKQVFPSRTIVRDDKLPDEKFFQFQITELRKASRKTPDDGKKLRTWARFLKKLTSGKSPKLRAQDAEHLYEIVRNRTRYEGTRYHRLMTDGLPQAYSAEAIILRGDRFLQAEEEYLMVGESRLGTAEGPGRIDLGLFARTVITNPKKPGELVVMKPVAVFDFKTRTSFDWEARTEKTKGKRRKTVPRIIVRKRGMTDEEWSDALTEIPEDDDTVQLDLYADGLVREYRRLTGDESVSDILKGVVLLDTQFDVGLNRSVLHSLLNVLVEDHSLKSKLKGCDRLLIRSKDSIAQRAALVLHSPAEDQFAVLKSERNLKEVADRYDPFSEVHETSTKHILYLSAMSASSSGFTVAWLAQYWHGLQYLQRLSSEQHNAPVTWLDLSGEFRDNDLARKRLRISHHEKDVQTFFDKIRIIDLSQSVEQFLFQGGSLPEIEPLLTKGIVVVSGWQWIEDSRPPRLKPVLEELERYMVQEIGKAGGTSVWFLQPRPDERTSEKYHSRCLLPFWDSSEHRFHVTDIVWNLPIRPYTSVQTTPMLDDLRMIVDQTRETVERNLVEVPILENWSARFWSKKSKRTSKKWGQTGNRGRDALSAKDIIGMQELREELISDSTDLIPWLCVLHPDTRERGEEQDITLSPQVIPLYGKPMDRKSIMTRVRYRAKIRGAKGMRGYVSTQQLIPKQTITHSRHYRRFRRKKRRAVNTQTYRAPDEAHLEYRNLREQTARNVEIRRLRQMVRFFSGHKESWTRELLWRDLLRQLDGFIPDTRSPIEIDALYKMSELLMNHEATSDLWGSILWVRERRLGDGLRLNEQEHLATLLESRPYVTTLLGNYLFLFLVALQMKYPDLRIDQLQSLWSVMKSWHLKQLGFYLKDVRGVSRPKFDVRAIWPNLNKRASILSQIPLPVQSAVRHGQLLVAPNGDEYNYWLFLEDHYDQTLLRSGFWIGRSPLDPDPSVKWSESDTSVIADHATDVEPEEVRNLLTCRMEETEYVWLFAEENWNPLGKLSIIPRKRGAITNIRGLQVVPVDSSGMPAAPVGVSVPSHLSSRIRRELSEISNMQQHIISVECMLSIDSDLYSLSLQSDGEELDTRCFELTSELLQVLRRPLVEGVPLQSTRNPNHYFTWDPYKNIEYAELQLLRPYVERKTPFIHIRAPLPFSCQDLLEQSSESVSIQVTHDNAVCPVADGSSNVHGVCWRLVLIGDYYDADLVTLVEQPVLDLDVVSLMKAGEVFLDGARYELEIDFENDPATREGIVFRESRLIARHLGLKPVTPGVSLGMENERLTWTASRSRKIIEIPMVSDVIRERVDTLKLQVPEDDDWSIEEVFETAEDMIGEFVEQHFGDSEEPEVRIVGLDSLYENIRLQLLHIKLEEVESVLVDEDSLNLKVELCRQASSADPAYAVNLAETLYELALFHLRNRAFGDAKQAIDECIEVYESYYETWREEWVKEKLRSARSLKTRVERQP